MRPNVLLLVLDAARADALEPYGAAAGSTPTVAQLARRGRAIDDVFAAACWTVPSHASMFTGLLPRAAGLCRAPGGTPHGCRPVLAALGDRLLPEVMRRAGYATGAVSANLWLSENSGFNIGFEDFATVDSGRQTRVHRSGLRVRAGWALEALRARVDDGAAEVERVLSSWLGRPRDRPFFWFVNLIECHSPYLPPRPYDDLPAIQRLRAAEDARRHLTLDAIWRACAGGFDASDGAIRRMRHLYARCIRYMDDWLARLLEAMDRRGILDDTLVIVTSDHGENIGESGRLGHALSLDDRLLRVPLVVAGPGASGPGPIRSLAAIPRFIADAVGLTDHPWDDGAVPADVALAQFDPPASRDDPRLLEAVDRWGLGDEALARMTTPLTAATDGRLKLLLVGDEERLFDLQADPLEERPLDPTDGYERARVDRLRAALADPAVRRSAAVPPPRGEEAASPEELQQLEDRMRLLGYL